MSEKKTVGGTNLREPDVAAGTGKALVETAPEHRKEYEMIRQMGDLDLEHWPDARILAVRQMFAEHARNTVELAMFMHVAHRHNLDPALNEIQLIPTKKGPKAYSGRDGFLKSASFHPEMYGGIQSGVVYAEDDFHVEVNGTDVRVHHVWSPLTRKGKPHGAFAIVYDAAGHPTYVYRERAKCENLKSSYWTEHPDDAIHNRAVAGALRRVVPLGGLFIFGEQPVDSGATPQASERLHKSATERLRDISVKLGVAHQEEKLEPELSVRQDGSPYDEGEIDELLEDALKQFRVPLQALAAWTRRSSAVPRNPAEWTIDHKTVALQELHASEGMDFLREWAQEMAEMTISDVPTRLDLSTEILNCHEREKLDKIVERLQERTSGQARQDQG